MSSKVEKTKKPFDKKKWRTKKYSNKQKFQEWDERRKKAVIRDYYKELNKSDNERSLDTLNGKDIDLTKQQKRPNPYKEAQERYNQIQEEKKTRRLEALKKKEEIKQALEEYKQKKKFKNKKLGKKTKKGQPVMKERLELLLEKIQANINT
ncbi:thyroid transcription factor 1-associated protein 26 [Melanaphis sacchari]|uniref:thyroid transcription factor 1-associated protein 26 n=1 Tax=Melanaphis sacchari TaxID=742174 RepID=UPI000DC135C4|nr:thyroid transcription factor 1-associated protein 26 [Melanaphis sacchari]